MPKRLVKPLKEKILTIQMLGVIEPFVNEWSSPIVVVPKTNVTLRVCMNRDYKV